MATITGTVHTPGSVAAKGITVAFMPLDTPLAVGSQIIETATIRVITDSSGALPAGLTLVAGNYTVALSANGTNYGSFNILVPSGSSTYDITGIVVAAAGPSAHQFLVLERSDGQYVKWFAVLENGTTEGRWANYP